MTPPRPRSPGPSRAGITLAALVAALGAGCTERLVLPESTPTDGGGSGGRAAGGTGGITGTGGARPPFDGGMSCSQLLMVFRRTADVMLVVGRNASMATPFGNGTRMSVEQELLRDLVRRPGVSFGYQEFPWTDSFCSQGICCSGGMQYFPGPNSAVIETAIGRCPANPTTSNSVTPSCVSSSEARPLAGELKRVRDLYAPFGPEPLTDRYVLLTIDGPPSCPYEDPRRMCESAMQEMTRLAGAMAAVKTFVVALGDDAAGDPCLEELALMGGAASERPDPLFVARNRDDLQRAFDNVFDEVASSVCELNLAPGSFDPSRSSIAIYIRDEEIPRDRMRQNGWDFVDRSNLRIQLYGNACESLKSTEPRDVFVWSCRG